MTLEAGELKLDTAFAATDGQDAIPHIAVPTTLSAGEYTPGGGTTDEATRVKHGVLDPRLQAKVVIHDPELTLATPDWLWAATGCRALDHAVEAAYSSRAQPFVDALAAKAIALLAEHLPLSIRSEGEARVAHRGCCQIAAWLSLFGGFNTGLGVSHAFGHQIGPMWDVPHGVTSAITLPHAMRLVASISPGRFEPIALGLGLPFDPVDPEPGALACADAVAALIAGLPVAHTLKAAGVPHNRMREVAKAVHEEIALFGVTDRPITLNEVTAVIDAAWDEPPGACTPATPVR
jgi:alcohol dehydrogenase